MIKLKTYKDFCNNYQKSLKSKLLEEQIDGELIHRVLESGFYLFNNIVIDGYYGSKSGILLETFVKHLKNHDYLSCRTNIPTYEVSSVKEAINILNKPQYKKVINDLCFRGQISQYIAKRPFPHPVFSNEKGEEILLLPGIWRNYLDETGHVLNSRPFSEPETFLKVIEDELIFKGINVPKLMMKNKERYELYSHSDIENLPDKESKEYWERYRIKQSSSYNLFFRGVFEQHYGLETTGLDVTFNLKTALFFATHKFNLKNDLANYSKIKNEHSGVVYILRFSAPKLTKTKDMIKEITDWNHLYPKRPVMQDCALPFFDSTKVNEAIPHIVGIIKIREDFDYTSSLTASDLFPNQEDDSFYKSLLELKLKYPTELEKIVQYDI